MTCFSSIAQTYTPFPTKNAIWTSSVTYGGDLVRYNNYQITSSNSDTLINGIIYNKVRTKGGLGLLKHDIEALREDGKKIYMRLRIGNEGKDSLLYDFNVKLGDSLKGKAFPSLQQFVVVNIDSVSINNIFRKRYWIGFRSGDRAYYLLEGVGCNCGFIPYPILFESSGRLECHSVGNQQIFGGETGQCLLLANKNPQIELAKIKISPNPIIDVGQMEIPNDVAVDNIKVYDYLGRLMYATTINQNSVSISANDYAAGMYFVHIYNKQTLVGISKFVIEK